jgi:hypothetical protein
VAVLPLGRWWCVKIGNAKENGFISIALTKRSFQMYGCAKYVACNRIVMEWRKDLNDIEYFIFL